MWQYDVSYDFTREFYKDFELETFYKDIDFEKLTTAASFPNRTRNLLVVDTNQGTMGSLKAKNVNTS